MRVLIVDDSAFMRKAITQMIESDPEMEVVGTAYNGAEALRLAADLKPDAITLDIEMPQMDGLTALRHIMKQCPTNVIMLSSLTTEGSHAALKALSLGAADFLAKDQSQFSLSITNIQQELLTKLHALRGRKPRAIGTVKAPTAASTPPPATGKLPSYRASQFDAVCIGSSTGGPPILETILSHVPAAMHVPIVVAQHMPELFTRSLAERLAGICTLPVVHVQNGMPLERGRIHLAPGGKHIHLERVKLAQYRLVVDDEPQTAVFKPSVDELLRSASEACGGRALGIVLTGIGADGAVGGKALYDRGGRLIGQDAASCVVYGMPRAVAEAKIIDAALPPESIAAVLATLADRHGRVAV